MDAYTTDAIKHLAAFGFGAVPMAAAGVVIGNCDVYMKLIRPLLREAREREFDKGHIRKALDVQYRGLCQLRRFVYPVYALTKFFL